MSDWKSSLLAVLVVIVTVAMLADLSAAPRSKFTQANYERLEIGMTMDEAIAILGEPSSVDRSLRDLAWTMWYSPFDTESSITCIFVEPTGGILHSIEKAGTLPARPLLIPDEIPQRRIPRFVEKLERHAQLEERQATLMLRPLKPASNGPVLP